MKVGFDEDGWEDYLHWQRTDSVMLERLNQFIKACRRSPFEGLGKTEPLKHEFKGWWSRRITREHRMVYRVTGSGEDQRLEVIQCRYHY